MSPETLDAGTKLPIPSDNDLSIISENSDTDSNTHFKSSISSKKQSQPQQNDWSEERSGRSSNRSGRRPGSRSPIKTLTDLHLAKRPPKFEALNGETAQQAGGVLENYQLLVQISRGNGVIPKSLKVRFDLKSFDSVIFIQTLI